MYTVIFKTFNQLFHRIGELHEIIYNNLLPSNFTKIVFLLKYFSFARILPEVNLGINFIFQIATELLDTLSTLLTI